MNGSGGGCRAREAADQQKRSALRLLTGGCDEGWILMAEVSGCGRRRSLLLRAKRFESLPESWGPDYQAAMSLHYI